MKLIQNRTLSLVVDGKTYKKSFQCACVNREGKVSNDPIIYLTVKS
jgi:hypothetical protein